MEKLLEKMATSFVSGMASAAGSVLVTEQAEKRKQIKIQKIAEEEAKMEKDEVKLRKKVEDVKMLKKALEEAQMQSKVQVEVIEKNSQMLTEPLQIKSQFSQYYVHGKPCITQSQIELSLPMKQFQLLGQLASSDASIAVLYPAIYPSRKLMVGVSATTPVAVSYPVLSLLGDYEEEGKKIAKAQVHLDMDTKKSKWGRLNANLDLTFNNSSINAYKDGDYLNCNGRYCFAEDCSIDVGIGQNRLTSEKDAKLGFKFNNVQGFDIEAGVTGTRQAKTTAAAGGTYSISKIGAEVSREHKGVRFKMSGEINPTKPEPKLGFSCCI